MKRNNYRVEPSGIKDNKRRFMSLRKRLPEILHPSLDACEPNPIGLALGMEGFASGDFNWTLQTEWDDYQTVTSFEVIEHLQNPLLYLRNIHRVMRYGGRLYLTTPVKWAFKGKHHFHEFTRDELEFCFTEAGFAYIHIERMQGYDLRNVGIRPLIRKLRDMIWGQIWFVTAIK